MVLPSTSKFLHFTIGTMPQCGGFVYREKASKIPNFGHKIDHFLCLLCVLCSLKKHRMYTYISPHPYQLQPDNYRVFSKLECGW